MNRSWRWSSRARRPTRTPRADLTAAAPARLDLAEVRPERAGRPGPADDERPAPRGHGGRGARLAAGQAGVRLSQPAVAMPRPKTTVQGMIPQPSTGSAPPEHPADRQREQGHRHRRGQQPGAQRPDGDQQRAQQRGGAGQRGEPQGRLLDRGEAGVHGRRDVGLRVAADRDEHQPHPQHGQADRGDPRGGEARGEGAGPGGDEHRAGAEGDVRGHPGRRLVGHLAVLHGVQGVAGGEQHAPGGDGQPPHGEGRPVVADGGSRGRGGRGDGGGGQGVSSW